MLLEFQNKTNIEIMLSVQLSPEENCPRLESGFGSRLRLVLELGVNQTIVPEENSHPVRVRVWIGLF